MNDFEKSYNFLGRSFDMPIAEVIYKEHHGMFFFSKINVKMLYFSWIETEFILNPVEIVYIDLTNNKMTEIWRKKKNETNELQDMKSAIQKWIKFNRIPSNSIVDYGPYSQIYSLTEFIMSKEELNSYLIKPENTQNSNIAFGLLNKIEKMKIFKENKEEDKEKLRKLKATLSRARYDHMMSQIKDFRRNFRNRN